MRKNRAIIMALILFSMAHSAFAEQQDVCLEFHRWDIPDNNAKVNRAPMLLPIEAVYDSDNHIRVHFKKSRTLLTGLKLF